MRRTEILLKASEFMLGDFVKVDDLICEVYQIFEDEVRLLHNGTEITDEDSYAMPIDRIEPIPLTAEILENNGLHHNEYEYLNTFNKWQVHVDTDDMRTIGSIELTYVHQFQQFLRLCGMNELADNFKI